MPPDACGGLALLGIVREAALGHDSARDEVLPGSVEVAALTTHVCRGEQGHTPSSENSVSLPPSSGSPRRRGSLLRSTEARVLACRCVMILYVCVCAYARLEVGGK